MENLIIGKLKLLKLDNQNYAKINCHLSINEINLTPKKKEKKLEEKKEMKYKKKKSNQKEKKKEKEKEKKNLQKKKKLRQK